MAEVFGTVSAAFGVFGNCLHAYRAITTAIEFGSDAVVWHVQVRIERFRFEIWARILGFLDPKTGGERQPPGHGESVTAQGFSEVLQIPGVQELVTSIFTAIQKELDEFDRAARKYRLRPDQEESYEPLTKTPWWKSERMRRRFKKMPDRTKNFAMHIALVMKDPNTVKDLLRKLSDLNNGLEKILSAAQRNRANEALASAVLTHYDEPWALTAVWRTGIASTESTNITNAAEVEGAPAPTRPAELASAAMIKQELVEARTTGPAVSHFDESSSNDDGIAARELDSSLVTFYGAPETTENKYFWPLTLASFAAGKDTKPIQTIVEWRKPHLDQIGANLNFNELEKRRDLLVDLLHKASDTDSYRILDCLGYVAHRGRLDGKVQDVIGFVSAIPDWADGSKTPVTLQGLLSASFDSDETGTVPSLRVRFALARIISTALYQLQCSSWLHRNLTSHNIVFFHDQATGRPRLDAPFMVGLQYSRPDDQSRGDRDKPWSEGVWDIPPAVAIYLHPHLSEDRSRSGGRRGRRRYRRSYDVYSLGIVLFEIAMWEPVLCFLGSGSDVVAASRKIRECVERELVSEVGEMYRDAVVACLDGLTPSGNDSDVTSSDGEDEAGYDGVYRGEDPGVGLEVDLFWKVVQEIGHCVV